MSEKGENGVPCDCYMLLDTTVARQRNFPGARCIHAVLYDGDQACRQT